LLNVSGNTTLSNTTACLSLLNVCGVVVLANITTCTSILQVNGSLVVNSDLPNILLKTTNTYNFGVATTMHQYIINAW